MTSIDRSRALQVLRECQDRRLEREGIPMVLALTSEVGAMPAVVDEPARSAGAELGASMDDFRAALVPSSRDDDLGCLISVLQAVSFADFAGPEQHLDPEDVEIPHRDVL